jgi:hypothetical protein
MISVLARIGVVLSTCLILSGLWSSRIDAASLQEDVPGERVEVVEGDWGDVSVEEIASILDSVDSHVREMIGTELKSILRVEPKGGPILLHKRDEDGGFRVKLETGGRYWSQLIYQFSHELTHAYCRKSSGVESHLSSPHDWFEEMICEAVSLRVLHDLSVKWKIDPPYKSLQSYAPQLSKYAVRTAQKCESVPREKFQQWYDMHRESLASGVMNREEIRTVSLYFAEFLKSQPRLWNRIPDLANGEALKDESFIQRLERWFKSWGTEDQELQQQILALFGKSN